MRTLTINGIDYTNYLADGFVINQTNTEELDTGTIILNGLIRTKFQPFNKVVINEDETTYYLCIDTFVETRISNHPQLFQYTINLISETKVLERFILPNLKITKSLVDGTTITIYDFIYNLFSRYCNLPIYIDDAISQFKTINMPEYSWATPTLKQVLNDIFSTLDKPKLCKIENDILKLIDISVLNNEITSLQQAVQDDDYQASKEYVNNLVSEINNVIPQQVNSKTVPLMSYRSNDTAFLKTNDLEIWVPNARIEKLEKVIVSLFGNGLNANNVSVQNVMADIDITDLIVEKEVYDTLYIESLETTDSGLLKNNHLYFEHGGDTIKGLTYNDNEFEWVLGTPSWERDYAINNVIKLAVQYLLKGKYYDEATNTWIDLIDFTPRSDFKDFTYQVWYKNIGEIKTKVYRTNEKDLDLSLVDNQTSSDINYEAFLKSQREKINRLGNEIKTITMLFKNYDDIPKLNDYFGDYILAKRTITHHSYGFIFQGTFSKNYIQKNLYYGLKSKTRFIQYSKANQTVLRKELLRREVYFETTDRTMGASDNMAASYIAVMFAGIEEKELGIQQIIATSRFKSGETKSVFLQPSIYVGDYSFTISCRYLDNINVGMKIDREFVLFQTKYNQRYVSYVDENGSLNRVRLELYGRYANNVLTIPTSSDQLDENNGVITLTDVYPEFIDGFVDEQYKMHDFIEYLTKDNGEILQFDMQYDLIGSADVVVGLELAKYNAITDLATTNDFGRCGKSKLQNLKIYYSTSEQYQVGDLMAKGEIYESGFISEENYLQWLYSGTKTNEIKLVEYNVADQEVEPNMTTWQSWAIATESGELLIGVNRKNDNISSVVYVNIK